MQEFRPIRLPILLLLLAAWPSAGRACLWHSDTDTLEEEGRGIPEIINVITGRFPRNPPLYYQMRLDRVTAAMETEPDNLLLYDDAAVACDKLGRVDDAIAWMERKLARIEKLEADGGGTSDLKRHRYRYLANIGTFYVHRWFAGGADTANMDDVKKSRDFIARAIELNPEAHFGRERYQLMILEWLLEDWTGKLRPEVFLKSPKYGYPVGAHRLPAWWDKSREKALTPPEAGMADAVEGVGGLIALGLAWEMEDVFNALKVALLIEKKTWVAYLAELRRREIFKKTHTPEEIEEAEETERSFTSDTWDTLEDIEKPFLNEYEALYGNLRKNAEAWNAHRTEYMMARLREGRHPDTDKTFWDGYVADPPPPLDVEYKLSWIQKRQLAAGHGRTGSIFFFSAMVGVAAVFGLLIAVQVRRKGWRSLFRSSGRLTED